MGVLTTQVPETTYRITGSHHIGPMPDQFSNGLRTVLPFDFPGHPHHDHGVVHVSHSKVKSCKALPTTALAQSRPVHV